MLDLSMASERDDRRSQDIQIRKKNVRLTVKFVVSQSFFPHQDCIEILGDTTT